MSNDVNLGVYESFFTMPDVAGGTSSAIISVPSTKSYAQIFYTSPQTSMKRLYFMSNIPTDYVSGTAIADANNLQVDVYSVTYNGTSQTFTLSSPVASFTGPFNSVSNDSGEEGTAFDASWYYIDTSSSVTLQSDSYYAMVFSSNISSSDNTPSIYVSGEYRQSIFPILMASTDSGSTYSNDLIPTTKVGNTRTGAIVCGFVGQEVDDSGSNDFYIGETPLGSVSSSRRGYPVYLFVQNLSTEITSDNTVSLQFMMEPPSNINNGTSDETDQCMMRWYYYKEGTLPLSEDPFYYKTMSSSPVLGNTADFVLFVQPDRFPPYPKSYLPVSNITLESDEIEYLPVDSLYEMSDHKVIPDDYDPDDSFDRGDLENWIKFSEKRTKILETSGGSSYLDVGDRDPSLSTNPSYLDISLEKRGDDVRILNDEVNVHSSDVSITRGYNNITKFGNYYIAFPKYTTFGDSWFDEVPAYTPQYCSNNGLPGNYFTDGAYILIRGKIAPVSNPSSWSDISIYIRDEEDNDAPTDSPGTYGSGSEVFGTDSGVPNRFVGIHDVIVREIDGNDYMFVIIQSFPGHTTGATSDYIIPDRPFINVAIASTVETMSHTDGGTTHDHDLTSTTTPEYFNLFAIKTGFDQNVDRYDGRFEARTIDVSALGHTGTYTDINGEDGRQIRDRIWPDIDADYQAAKFIDTKINSNSYVYFTVRNNRHPSSDLRYNITYTDSKFGMFSIPLSSISNYNLSTISVSRVETSKYVNVDINRLNDRGFNYELDSEMEITHIMSDGDTVYFGTNTSEATVEQQGEVYSTKNFSEFYNVLGGNTSQNWLYPYVQDWTITVSGNTVTIPGKVNDRVDFMVKKDDILHVWLSRSKLEQVTVLGELKWYDIRTPLHIATDISNGNSLVLRRFPLSIDDELQLFDGQNSSTSTSGGTSGDTYSVTTSSYTDSDSGNIYYTFSEDRTENTSTGLISSTGRYAIVVPSGAISYSPSSGDSFLLDVDDSEPQYENWEGSTLSGGQFPVVEDSSRPNLVINNTEYKRIFYLPTAPEYDGHSNKGYSGGPDYITVTFSDGDAAGESINVSGRILEEKQVGNGDWNLAESLDYDSETEEYTGNGNYILSISKAEWDSDIGATYPSVGDTFVITSTFGTYWNGTFSVSYFASDYNFSGSTVDYIVIKYNPEGQYSNHTNEQTFTESTYFDRDHLFEPDTLDKIADGVDVDITEYTPSTTLTTQDAADRPTLPNVSNLAFREYYGSKSISEFKNGIVYGNNVYLCGYDEVLNEDYISSNERYKYGIRWIMYDLRTINDPYYYYNDISYKIDPNIRSYSLTDYYGSGDPSGSDTALLTYPYRLLYFNSAFWGVYHYKTLAKYDYDKNDPIFNNYPALSVTENNPRIGIYCGMVGRCAGWIPSWGTIGPFDNNLNNRSPRLFYSNGISYMLCNNDEDGFQIYKTYGLKTDPEDWGMSNSLNGSNDAGITYNFNLDEGIYEKASSGSRTFVNVAKAVEISPTNDNIFLSEMRDEVLISGSSSVVSWGSAGALGSGYGYGYIGGSQEDWLDYLMAISTGGTWNDAEYYTDMSFENALDPNAPERSILCVGDIDNNNPQNISFLYDIRRSAGFGSDDTMEAKVQSGDNTAIKIKISDHLEGLFYPDNEITVYLNQSSTNTGDPLSEKRLLSIPLNTDGDFNFVRIETPQLIIPSSNYNYTHASGDPSTAAVTSDTIPYPREINDVYAPVYIKSLKINDINLGYPETVSSVDTKKIVINGVSHYYNDFSTEYNSSNINISQILNTGTDNGCYFSDDNEAIVVFPEPIYINSVDFNLYCEGNSRINNTKIALYGISTYQKQNYGENSFTDSDWSLLSSINFSSDYETISFSALKTYVRAIKISFDTNVTLRANNLSISSFVEGSSSFEVLSSSFNGRVYNPELIIVDNIESLIDGGNTDGISPVFASFYGKDAKLKIDIGESIPCNRISLNIYNAKSTDSIKIETSNDGSSWTTEYSGYAKNYAYSFVNWVAADKENSRFVDIDFIDTNSISDEVSDFVKEHSSNFSSYLSNNSLSSYSFKPNIYKDDSLIIYSSSSTPYEESTYDGYVTVNSQMDEDGPFSDDIGQIGLVEKNLNVKIPLKNIRYVRVSSNNATSNTIRMNGFKAYTPIIDTDGSVRNPITYPEWTISIYGYGSG